MVQSNAPSPLNWLMDSVSESRVCRRWEYLRHNFKLKRPIIVGPYPFSFVLSSRRIPIREQSGRNIWERNFGPNNFCGGRTERQTKWKKHHMNAAVSVYRQRIAPDQEGCMLHTSELLRSYFFYGSGRVFIAARSETPISFEHSGPEVRRILGQYSV